MSYLIVGRALTLFLFLAIAVASVGLFGMAAHAAQERTKEIGIRKVFGASPGGLTAMLTARLCQTRCYRFPPQRADRLRLGQSLATGVLSIARKSARACS